jgi:hypothetical protein
MSDGDAERIEDRAGGADGGTLLRWVRQLLEERRERSALLLRLARPARALEQSAPAGDRLLTSASPTTTAAARRPAVQRRNFPP